MKKILISGASGYVGNLLLKNFLDLGHEVFALYHETRPTLEHKNLNLFQCDLLDTETIKETFYKITSTTPRLDTLICAHAPKLSEDDFLVSWPITHDKRDYVHQIVINATMTLIDLALPLLHNANNPNIILMGSSSGEKSLRIPVHFATSQSALKGLVESLGKIVGTQNVKINIVAPGILAGGIGAKIPKSLRDDYLKHTSLKRLGTSQEVSQFIAWFALNNTFVTSHHFILDGGL